jgi:hypothetical protein
MATETIEKVDYYITPEGRLSYVNAWTPRKKMPGDEGKPDVYDCMLIMEMPKHMPKEDQERYQRLRKLVVDKANEKWTKNKPVLQSPFRTTKGLDGSEGFISKPLDGNKNPEYAGKLVIKAVSYGRKPQVLRPDKEEMMEQAELYSGCYGRLWVTAFAYDNAGNKGVSFSLQGILKTKDGQPLGGSGGKATEAFKSIEIESNGFETVEDDDDLDL